MKLFKVMTRLPILHGFFSGARKPNSRERQGDSEVEDGTGAHCGAILCISQQFCGQASSRWPMSGFITLPKLSSSPPSSLLLSRGRCLVTVDLIGSMVCQQRVFHQDKDLGLVLLWHSGGDV